MIYIPFETQKTQISQKIKNFSLSLKFKIIRPTPQFPKIPKKSKFPPTPFSCLPHTSANKKSPHISCEPYIKYLIIVILAIQNFLTINHLLPSNSQIILSILCTTSIKSFMVYPFVVIAAVPILMPLVSFGLLFSFGTQFLFNVILFLSHAS